MKRNLILTTELQRGYQDVRLMDWVAPYLRVKATNYRVGIKITDLPEWSYSHRTIPDFLRGFAAMYKDALIYLLDDATEIVPGQCMPECTFKHLTQLADFLKETI